MRIVFWIFFAITVSTTLGAFVSYRTMMFLINSGEGGDSFGSNGLLAGIAMVLLIILSFVGAMFTLGLWFSEKNRRKSKDHVFELD
ncbi:hypothetical protein BH10ACI2_BH10ACI2_14640 [soil metagenome]